MLGASPFTPWRPCPPGTSWLSSPRALGSLAPGFQEQASHKEMTPEHTQEPFHPASSLSSQQPHC